MHPSGFGSFWILLLIMMLSAWSRSSLLTGQARPALRSLPALIHTLRPVASRCICTVFLLLAHEDTCRTGCVFWTQANPKLSSCGSFL